MWSLKLTALHVTNELIIKYNLESWNGHFWRFGKVFNSALPTGGPAVLSQLLALGLWPLLLHTAPQTQPASGSGHCPSAFHSPLGQPLGLNEKWRIWRRHWNSQHKQYRGEFLQGTNLMIECQHAKMPRSQVNNMHWMPKTLCFMVVHKRFTNGSLIPYCFCMEVHTE